MRIDCVFFDFGGVIAEEGFSNGLRAMGERYGVDPERVFRAGYDIVFERGYAGAKIDEARFWNLLREEVSEVTGTDDELREMVLSRFAVRPWMIDVLDSLKKQGVRLYILSDQTNWLDELDKRQDFYRHFDRVFNSWRHGMTKREHDFFRLALRETGEDASRSLFVDDNAANVERSRDVGLFGIHYTTREAFESELAAYLRD